MLLLDVDVCLYAYRPRESERARRVSDRPGPRLVGHERLAVTTSTLSAVVRIATHPRVYVEPSTPADAVAFCTSLRTAPAVSLIREGERVMDIFSSFVTGMQLRGNDVPDALLAATALDAGAGLATLDKGFHRFDGLRVVHPE